MLMGMLKGMILLSATELRFGLAMGTMNYAMLPPKASFSGVVMKTSCMGTIVVIRFEIMLKHGMFWN